MLIFFLIGMVLNLDFACLPNKCGTLNLFKVYKFQTLLNFLTRVELCGQETIDGVFGPMNSCNKYFCMFDSKIGIRKPHSYGVGISNS